VQKSLAILIDGSLCFHPQFFSGDMAAVVFCSAGIDFVMCWVVEVQLQRRQSAFFRDKNAL